MDKGASQRPSANPSTCGTPSLQPWGGTHGWAEPNSFFLSHKPQQADIISSMEQILTLVCKLQPTPEEATHIDATMGAFADACAYIHATIAERITNVMRMQVMLYYDVRSRFGLSSNLAQQAFRRVWCCIWCQRPIPPKCVTAVCISALARANALSAPIRRVAGQATRTSTVPRTSVYWGCL